MVKLFYEIEIFIKKAAMLHSKLKETNRNFIDINKVRELLKFDQISDEVIP